MSADSRSAQKWKGMVIGMDKKEAAQKLMSIFGNVDAIAVLHSVLVLSLIHISEPTRH